MLLKKTPRLGARYWTAIMIASMCGTNLGDVFPDILKWDAFRELGVLAVAFLAVLLADRLLRHGSEWLYWLAILVVRGAATSIADDLVAKQHLTYWSAAVALAVVLGGLVIVSRRVDGPPGDRLPADGLFWAAMLTAGTLGTLIGDGFGHAFGPMTIGYPVSAAMATLALAVALSVRRRPAWRSIGSYWVTVVMVRWWGTNLGDILAFVAGLTTSLVVTGAALVLVLAVWRDVGADETSRETA